MRKSGRQEKRRHGMEQGRREDGKNMSQKHGCKIIIAGAALACVMILLP
jgi:hypothetical protein